MGISRCLRGRKVLPPPKPNGLRTNTAARVPKRKACFDGSATWGSPKPTVLGLMPFNPGVITYDFVGFGDPGRILWTAALTSEVGPEAMRCASELG